MTVRIEMADERTRPAVYEDTPTTRYRFAFGAGGTLVVFSSPHDKLEEWVLEVAWSPACWEQVRGEMLDGRARRELNL